MNWKLKAHGMAVLSRLPAGRWLYHSLQSALRTNRLAPEEGVLRAVEVCQLIAQAGQSIEGATVLEIGTGWRPFVPFLLSLVGAKRVITFDVNPWLNLAYATETYRVMEPHLALAASRLGVAADSIRQRYDRASRAAATLADLLGGLRIEYRCPGDASRTGLPDGGVDSVCSSNVLEHVPPDALRAIHGESFRVLRDGGLVVHRFNPADHFATVDGSITTVNFLRYSPREWHWYGGSGLSYHNRLRCVQHRELFESIGFSTVVDKVRVDSRGAEAIEKGALPVHPDFARYTPEQLAGGYMWFVGRKNAEPKQ
jgi:hypothetical protein